MEIKQKTIKKEVVFEGIGVHSGLNSRVVLKPSVENSGIVVKNIKFPDFLIEIGRVVPDNSNYSTTLSAENWKISTVEHLFAAINGLKIDNIIIEVEDFEIPIMDGSSYPFVKELLRAGILEQNAKKFFVTPKEKLCFEDLDNSRELIFYPAQKFSCNHDCMRKSSREFDINLYVNYLAEFDNPVIGSGEVNCSVSTDLFIKEIAPARTFGFLEQLPFMQKNGLAKGASLDNTVVIGENGYINERRFEDEFVRHKLLDLLGDLSLIGKQIAGKISAKRTGHSFNRKVVEHYIKNPDSWMLI